MASPPKEQQVHLHAFGSNGSWQLGLGHTEDEAKPQPVLTRGASSLASITSITCGGNHTVILYDNGEVAVAGDNSDGRCLSPIDRQEGEFSLVRDAFDKAGRTSLRLQHIAATWSATVAVTESGQVLTCGTGTFGELGLGSQLVKSQEPTAIEEFPSPNTTIKKLSSCMGHVVAVLSNGEVWGWGKGRQGQLGDPAENRWKPTKIDGIPFFAVDAVCGKDFTCIFGRPSTGQLSVLGPNGKDRFSIKTNAPTSVPLWKQVAASWGSVFVLLESGRLIGWGRDDHGQLPPQDLAPLKLIAAGSEHCLGLTEAGKVLAWGWGEHGNCGPRIDSNGNVKGQGAEIETTRAVTAVFAGCATSFVATPEPEEIG